MGTKTAINVLVECGRKEAFSMALPQAQFRSREDSPCSKTQAVEQTMDGSRFSSSTEQKCLLSGSITGTSDSILASRSASRHLRQVEKDGSNGGGGQMRKGSHGEEVH